MNSQLILLLIISLCIYLFVTKVQLKPKSKPPLFPPPALPPGGTYFPDYKGTNCSVSDQSTMEQCQLRYSECIEESLRGKADFSQCHREFMKKCMPVIRRCQIVAEEE